MIVQVTVFDFSTILERTETRVRDDLLGAGPKTVEELRSIAGRLRLRYQNQLERKIERAKLKAGIDTGDTSGTTASTREETASNPVQIASPQFKEAVGKATNFAGGLFAKVKDRLGSEPQASATLVDLPPVQNTPPVLATKGPGIMAPTSGNSAASSDGDWTGTDIAPATDGIMNFSIGDDDDDVDLL